MNHHSPDHHVRRIVLPSGRMIEVVRFDEPGAAIRPLHVCSRCRCELVQPVAWTEAGGERWELELECPNCWWRETGLFGREQLNAFEDRLDEGLTAMLNDLKHLAHANMAEEIDRFAAALRDDLILPEDF